MAKNQVTLTFAGDTKSLEGALRRASSESDKAGSKFAALGKTAALGLAGAAVAAAGLGAKMIDMASDAEEVRSKFETVFGKAVPALNKNIEAFSKATGASTFAMREQIANMGALLKPILGSTTAAADMSFKFTTLASDLASFNNVPVAQALDAIRSGLTGEAEPLRQFGVLINDAAVKAEAYRSGIAKVGKELTEQEKVQARANLIMQGTALAQGDATRTAGSFANQMKGLRSKISDVATEIGIKLLPYALDLVKWINTSAIPAIEDFAAKVGPALGRAFGKMGDEIREFKRQVEAVVSAVRTLLRLLPNQFGSIPSGSPPITGDQPGGKGGPGTTGTGTVVPGAGSGGGGSFAPAKPAPGLSGGNLPPGVRVETSWRSSLAAARAKPRSRRATATELADAGMTVDVDTTSPGALAYAFSQLTTNVADDLAALTTLVTEAEAAYAAARKTGLAAPQAAALGLLASARSNLAGLGPMSAGGGALIQGSGAQERMDLLTEILTKKAGPAAAGIVNNIVINTLDPAGAGPAVVRALQEYVHRNGKLVGVAA